MTVAEPTTVDEQLCFALYAASRAMTARYRPRLDPLGLTYPQYLVMLVLWERDGVTVGELGERVQLATGTLSPLVKRLEAQGLVRRTRRTDDERSVRLGLTEHGDALRARIPGVQAELAKATGLSHADVASLRDALHALTARLQEEPAGGDDRADPLPG